MFLQIMVSLFLLACSPFSLDGMERLAGHFPPKIEIHYGIPVPPQPPTIQTSEAVTIASGSYVFVNKIPLLYSMAQKSPVLTEALSLSSSDKIALAIPYTQETLQLLCGLMNKQARLQEYNFPPATLEALTDLALFLQISDLHYELTMAYAEACISQENAMTIDFKNSSQEYESSLLKEVNKAQKLLVHSSYQEVQHLSTSDLQLLLKDQALDSTRSLALLMLYFYSHPAAIRIPAYNNPYQDALSTIVRKTKHDGEIDLSHAESLFSSDSRERFQDILPKLLNLLGALYTEIHKLNLSHNNLDTLEITELAAINMHFRDTSNNFLARLRIRGLDRDKICLGLSSIKELIELDMSSCHLGNQSFESLCAHLKKLRKLRLQNNAISIIPQAMQGLHNLSELNLSDNNLNNKKTKGLLTNLPRNLRSLNLSSNVLSGQLEELLAQLRLLEYLDVSYNLYNPNKPENQDPLLNPTSSVYEELETKLGKNFVFRPQYTPFSCTLS